MELLIKSNSNITITNSSFDRNDPNFDEVFGGLKLSAGGAVLIDGVTSSHNAGNFGGLGITSASSITIKNSNFSHNTNGRGIAFDYWDGRPSPNITLSNVYLTDNRQGLYLHTKGNITLTGIHTDRNSDRGADLDTCNAAGSLCTWAGTGVITI